MYPKLKRIKNNFFYQTFIFKNVEKNAYLLDGAVQKM